MSLTKEQVVEIVDSMRKTYCENPPGNYYAIVWVPWKVHRRIRRRNRRRVNLSMRILMRKKVNN